MPQITRKLEFDYGHRVWGHESKCAHLHGHRGVLEVTVSAPDLDRLGRVIDFSEVKRILGGWVDEHWDHNLLLHPDDVLWEALGDFTHAQHEYAGADTLKEGEDRLTGGKAWYQMDHGNPTAENMAREFYEKTQALLPTHIVIVNVRFYETPNSWADFTPNPPWQPRARHRDLADLAQHPEGSP